MAAPQDSQRPHALEIRDDRVHLAIPRVAFFMCSDVSKLIIGDHNSHEGMKSNMLKNTKLLFLHLRAGPHRQQVMSFSHLAPQIEGSNKIM